MNYLVHECFKTFQGEGCHIGKPAFFIRLYGCPIHCPWCDSAGTWHPKWKPDHIQKTTEEFLANAALVAEVPTVVITGGEPAMYDLNPLIHFLHAYNMRVHLETSGHFVIQGTPDWITVSPKKAGPPIRDAVVRANEFKFIIEFPEDIEYYCAVLRDLGLPPDDPQMVPIWLHPEWGHRNDPVILQAISTAVMRAGGILRAGWQIHKLYQVDMLDPRSRGPVPLGGEHKRGF